MIKKEELVIKEEPFVMLSTTVADIAKVEEKELAYNRDQTNRESVSTASPVVPKQKRSRSSTATRTHNRLRKKRYRDATHLHDNAGLQNYMECTPDNDIFPVEGEDAPAGAYEGVALPGAYVAHVPGPSIWNAASTMEIDREIDNSDSDVDSNYGGCGIPATDYYNTAEKASERGIPDDEKVTEDSIKNAIANMEAAMDEEQINLLDEQEKVFEWSDDYSKFSGRPETFSGPTPGSTVKVNSPLEAFFLFWSADILQHIVTETNRYAKDTIEHLKATKKLKAASRFSFWHDTDVREVCVYFAMQILMGISIRMNYKEYWTNFLLLEMPGFKRLMSYNRFLLLNRFIHFSNNADYTHIQDSSKLFKLKPILKHLNGKFQSMYNLSREVCLDESLTLFKHRLSWKQSIGMRPDRFGVKAFELCEPSTGYLYKLNIYMGKATMPIEEQGSHLGFKTTQIVLGLLSGLENRGHLVTMDNFYNSPALARYLKVKGYDCLGTLRVNRMNVPIENARLSQNVPKGTLVARHSGDVSVISWRDNKAAHMLSTYHDPSTYVGTKAVTKLIAVRDFNNIMSGVDLKDQRLSVFMMERKTCVKWYTKIFRRLLRASILNSFIIFKSCRSTPTMTHKEFRLQLADELVKAYEPTCMNPAQPKLFSRPLRLYRGDIVHIPVKLSTKEPCVVCSSAKLKMRTNTKCGTCDRVMCFGQCWKVYHYSEVL